MAQQINEKNDNETCQDNSIKNAENNDMSRAEKGDYIKHKDNNGGNRQTCFKILSIFWFHIPSLPLFEIAHNINNYILGRSTTKCK